LTPTASELIYHRLAGGLAGLGETAQSSAGRHRALRDAKITETPRRYRAPRRPKLDYNTLLRDNAPNSAGELVIK